jgi:hypothetical protein
MLQTIKSVLEIIGLLFGSGLVGGLITKGVKLLWQTARKWIVFSTAGIPRKTLIILPPNDPWWHMGGFKGNPAMQIVAHCEVTNITLKPIRVVAARLRKPKTNGYVLVRHPENNIYGSYYIMPGHTVPVSADFWIQPPFKKERESFKTDLCLVDQFGNSHWSDEIEFIYT